MTEWSKRLSSRAHRYLVCSGGGGGIMEAANRGASDAHGRTIGLIGLPEEQRPKLDRRIAVLLYGSSYWKEILNFDGLVRHGMISPDDLRLFHYVDDPATALDLQQALTVEPEETCPAFASSCTPRAPRT